MATLAQFSPTGGGLTGYSDALYTTQLSASATATGSTRCSLLAACERQLLEQAVAVPLLTKQKRLLVANGIEGLVFDPFGPVRHRRAPERLAVLASQLIADPAERLQAVLNRAPLGLDASQLAAAENCHPGTLVTLLPTAHHSERAGWLIGSQPLEALGKRVAARLAQHHEQHGDERGVERDRLRRMIAPLLPAPAFAEWLEHWLAEGRLARRGSAWHLPGHRLELDPHDRRRADTLLPWLLDKPFDPPWVRDLARDMGMAEAPVSKRVRIGYAEAEGEHVHIRQDRQRHPGPHHPARHEIPAKTDA